MSCPIHGVTQLQIDVLKLDEWRTQVCCELAIWPFVMVLNTDSKLYRVKKRKECIICFRDISGLVNSLAPVAKDLNKFISKLHLFTLEELQLLK